MTRRHSAPNQVSPERSALFGVDRTTLYLRLRPYVRHWRRTHP